MNNRADRFKGSGSKGFAAGEGVSVSEHDHQNPHKTLTLSDPLTFDLLTLSDPLTP